MSAASPCNAGSALPCPTRRPLDALQQEVHLRHIHCHVTVNFRFQCRSIIKQIRPRNQTNCNRYFCDKPRVAGDPDISQQCLTTTQTSQLAIRCSLVSGGGGRRIRIGGGGRRRRRRVIFPPAKTWKTANTIPKALAIHSYVV